MEQSQWQRQAALSGGFDAHGRELEAAKRAIIEEAAAKARGQEAPVHHDVYYDPSHPDADWSGFVRKRNVKKHLVVPSTLTPAADGSGLTTAPTARTHSPAVGKKRAAPAGGGPSLLAHDRGPRAGGDDGGMWKTTAQLQAERAPTPKEALGEKRLGLGANPRRRLPVRPDFQDPWPLGVAPPPSSSRDAVVGGRGEGGEEEDLVGYRAPPATWGGQRGASLLSGLGAKLREAQVLEDGGNASGGRV